jgi:hypothetical protein
LVINLIKNNKKNLIMGNLYEILNVDKNASKEILTSANFSELTNANEACTYAKHQYEIPSENVVCDSGSVKKMDTEFTTLAPIN